MTTHLETFLNGHDTAGHVKDFRLDCGTEFDWVVILTHLQKLGIEFHPPCPYNRMALRNKQIDMSLN